MAANVPPEVTARVKAGVAFLDQHGPLGWRDHIDLGKLDISCSCCCILGQLYGHFIDGRDLLGIPSKSAHLLGFSYPAVNAFNSFLPEKVDKLWNELNTAWLAELARASD